MATDQYPKVYLYKRIVQAKLFIDHHYTESIDLNNISDEAWFSKFHFIRLFKQVYGKTPHQYLIYVRIERARILLMSGMTVSEVCYSIGFESISSFCSLFKRSIGLTPMGYQIQQQQLKVQITESPLAFIPGCFAEKSGWK
ncbi:MAG: helix-turn-helix transcriptional regulator [Cytophagales bacterium]|nr:helix-turn-helix transcriptional regulator [Cytophaga sp.]